jgi:hypothetical protein
MNNYIEKIHKQTNFTNTHKHTNFYMYIIKSVITMVIRTMVLWYISLVFL